MAHGGLLPVSYQITPIPRDKFKNILLCILGGTMTSAQLWCEESYFGPEETLACFQMAHISITSNMHLWTEYFDFGTDYVTKVRSIFFPHIESCGEAIRNGKLVDRKAYYCGMIKGLVEVFRVDPTKGIIDTESICKDPATIAQLVSTIIRQFEKSCGHMSAWFPDTRTPRFEGEPVKGPKKILKWADADGGKLAEYKTIEPFTTEHIEEAPLRITPESTAIDPGVGADPVDNTSDGSFPTAITGPTSTDIAGTSHDEDKVPRMSALKNKLDEPPEPAAAAPEFKAAAAPASSDHYCCCPFLRSPATIGPQHITHEP